MKEKIREIQNQRLEICKQCENNSTSGGISATIEAWSYCKDCLCNLNAKSACMSCECPLKKWEAFITQEERAQMEQELKEEEGDETTER